MATLSHRRFRADDPEDERALQRLLEASPAYSLLVEGKLPSPTAAKEVLSELPPGKTATDKFVLGFSDASGLVGCADVVRGYPTDEVAYVGLLLFAESHQGRALGVEALAQIEALAASWNCTALRLGVVATNTRALAFWRREGFVELYRKPSPAYTGDVIVMERPLPPR